VSARDELIMVQDCLLFEGALPMKHDDKNARQ